MVVISDNPLDYTAYSCKKCGHMWDSHYHKENTALWDVHCHLCDCYRNIAYGDADTETFADTEGNPDERCALCNVSWQDHRPDDGHTFVYYDPHYNYDGPKDDPISHPKHYTTHPSGVECIQITEHMNFCLGNAIKYIWRADQKGGVEDLEKAKWYLTREIERRQLHD